MSIENPGNKKLNPAEIENKKEDEIWQSFTDQESKENIESVFKDVLEKLILEDYNYYLEETNEGLAVKKVDTNETIYFTDVEVEIEALYRAEKEGRVD